MTLTKTCGGCQLTKPSSEFCKKTRSKDGLQPWCKDCNRKRSSLYYQENKKEHCELMKARSHQHRAELKARVDAIKAEAGCLVCDENDPACLDFHHDNPNKEFSVGVAASRKVAWHKIEKEIAKCVVLCSNCHRKLHAGRKRMPVSSNGKTYPS